MASRPRRSAVARSTAVRSTTTGAGAASVSPASAFDNAADITRAREILSRFRCDRRVHSGDCMRDVAIASRARALDAIVDIKSQIFRRRNDARADCRDGREQAVGHTIS